jgi:hypothetical protein
MKYTSFTFETTSKTWEMTTPFPVYPDHALTLFCEASGLPATAVLSYYAHVVVQLQEVKQGDE